MRRQAHTGRGSDSPAVPRRAVQIHIEELVLHGFAPGDRHVIADAVRVELARLMEEGRFPQSWTGDLAVKQIEAGTFQVKRGDKSENSGTQVARAMFRGLGRQMRASMGVRNSHPSAGGGSK